MSDVKDFLKTMEDNVKAVEDKAEMLTANARLLQNGGATINQIPGDQKAIDEQNVELEKRSNDYYSQIDSTMRTPDKCSSGQILQMHILQARLLKAVPRTKANVEQQ